MTPTNFVVSELNSTATEQTVPVLPDHHVRYSRKEAHYAYTIRARPSFNIRLRRTGDYWVVWDTETGISGQGVGVLEAMRDFENAVKQHLDILEQQAALSEELSAQLEYLRARVQR